MEMGPTKLTAKKRDDIALLLSRPNLVH